MWWVLLFLGIGLVGLVVLGGLAVRLWRRLRALLEELGRAGDRTGELLDLLGQIRLEPAGVHDDLTAEDGHSSAARTYDEDGANAPGERNP